MAHPESNHPAFNNLYSSIAAYQWPPGLGLAQYVQHLQRREAALAEREAAVSAREAAMNEREGDMLRHVPCESQMQAVTNRIMSLYERENRHSTVS